MSSHERSNDRFIALVVIGVLALNYPLLSLFSEATLFLGIPILYFYLFLIWAAIIGLAAMIMGNKAKKGKASEQRDHGA